MPVHQLSETYWFPPPEEYEEHGLIAVGGDVHPDRLLQAYYSGIFPWYNEDDPISWFSPAWRMVLCPGEVRITKSSRNLLNRNLFEIRENTAFEEVITACQKIARKDQEGTWINEALKESMLVLHHKGIAHSIECYQHGQLVGGLYGLAIGRVFCGESMFSKVSNASRIAFIYLARKLEKLHFELIDCQVYNSYTESLGAYEIKRSRFLEIILRQDRTACIYR